MERTAKGMEGGSQAWSVRPFSRFMFWFAVLLLLGSTTLSVSLIAGLRAGNSLLHPNPFAEYEGLWPGQLIGNSAEIARRIPSGSVSCVTWTTAGKSYPVLSDLEGRKNPDTPMEVASCIGFPKDGEFNRMNLALENNHVSVLHLLSNTLHQDALFLYWGAPDVVSQAGIAGHWALQWNRSSYRATALVQQATSVVDDLTILANG